MDSSPSTPMLKQYREIKSKHQDCILFFRLGDFYEMFYDDAKIGSRVLDLVLTSRGKAPSSRIPMCGIPYHAAQNYIDRLVKAGHKVAICEQVEEPGATKGIVKRDVIRVITSGTYLDENSTDSRYILALSPNAKNIGIAFIDPTLGTIQTNQYPMNKNKIIEIISKLPIFECIYPEEADERIRSFFDNPLIRSKNITLSPYQDWCFNPEIAKKSLCEHFSIHNLHGFGIEELDYATASSGALLDYLKNMNKQDLRHIDRIALYTDDDYAYISPAAYRGLEIDTLIQTLDETQTALGKRKLRFWFTHPLKSPAEIEDRQEAIKLLLKNTDIQQNLKEVFSKIPDIEKNISRLSCGYTHAKDLLALRNTLERIPEMQKTLKPISTKNSLFEIEDIKELRNFLIKSVSADIPLSKPEGKIVEKGFNKELDALRDIQENGREFLKKLQEREIKRTGINSLKIGFNKVFGYYLEITKTHAKSVPEDYIRKQTLVNAERYITPELKEYEEKILTAQDKIFKIESDIIKEIRREILDESIALHNFCESIATIDVIYSLAQLAQSPDYVAPKVTSDTVLDIKEGRHPVVERTTTESFIPNDTLLDCDDNHLIILTGPNMAGKSTYIRQTAILVIMAQVGSFIPAQSANIGVVDKIFTRIGAHDDISRGQSTFMVEMNETADILNNLTDQSLVILDEIGRGTSTYDGLSLAWALAEHLQKTKARTLFATHFHELTALADQHSGVKNYNVAVKEWKDTIVFMHKIVPGSSDDSYGIYVAKLAGISNKVIDRAKNILMQLEMKNDLKENLKLNQQKEEQISLFSNANDPMFEEIKDTLDSLDVNNLTPIEVVNRISQLKEKLDEQS